MDLDTSKEKKKESLTALRKCFSAIVDRKQVNLEKDVIEVILKSELNILVENEALSAILPYMFLFYVRKWPGWLKSDEYYSGKISFNNWFKKFKRFIIFHMKRLNKNVYDEVVQSLANEKEEPHNTVKESCIDKTTQIDSNTLSLKINCRPSFMWNMSIEKSQDDLVFKKSSVLDLADITTEELVNWPFISIEFRTSGFHFKRKNCGVFYRYLSNSGNISLPQQDFFESIDYVDPSNLRKCCMMTELIDCTKYFIFGMERLKGSIPYENSDTIPILFDAFIADIQEINLEQTMATNTSVVFNIGRKSYMKLSNDVIANENDKDIKLYEFYVPRMETILYHFSVKTFEIPKITYRCEYCNESMATTDLVKSHLKLIHGGTCRMKCFKCEKVETVNKLAINRWKHDCTSQECNKT